MQLEQCVDYSLPLPPPPTSLSFSHILPTCTYVALCNPGAGCCDESGPPWGMCKQLQCQCWEHKTPGDLCSWHDVSVSTTCTDPLVMNIFFRQSSHYHSLQRCVIRGFVIKITAANQCHCIFFFIFFTLHSLKERHTSVSAPLWEMSSLSCSGWLPSFIPSVPAMLFSDCHFRLASHYSKPLLISNWRGDNSSPVVCPNADT